MKNYIVIALLFLVSNISFSQNLVEFTLGAGVTIIDIEKLVEIDEIPNTTAQDWGIGNFGISGQYFLQILVMCPLEVK